MKPHSRRCTRFSTILLVLGLLVLGACDDAQSPDGETAAALRPGLTAAIVSNPTAPPASGSVTSGVSLRVAATDGIVYVSLQPGVIPDGERVTIRNPRTGGTVEAVVVDGGFDPVGIGASAGDTLDVDVQVSGGATGLGYMVVVPERRPPIVVRTDPPPRKRDVPLNATMLIVFSEPMDPTTITGETVRLQRNEQLVEGRVILEEGLLRARFLPDAPLEATSEYVLTVTNAVADSDGDRLEEAVSVTFETDSSVSAVASVFVESGVTLAPGESIQLFAEVRDTAGNRLSTVAAWTSADDDVATVDTMGVVRAIAVGTTTVTVTIENSSASATIDVVRLRFIAVDAGGEVSCALTSDGAAYCWGAGGWGQLGNGVEGRRTPTRVVGGLVFTEVSVGGGHNCALTPSGEAYCWGYNEQGQLGTAVPPERCGRPEFQVVEYACSTRPVPVAGDLRFVSISAGEYHTCGVTTDGSAYCWGHNWYGELGDGSTRTAWTPSAVAGQLRFTSISAGWNLTCGITENGAAFCWGLSHWYGPPFTYTALGDGVPGGPELCDPPGYDGWQFPCSRVPVPVVGDLAFATVSAGWLHACALTAAGTAYCWGGGPGVVDSVPQAVRNGSAHRGIAAAPLEGPGCVIAEDSEVFCWRMYWGSGGPTAEPAQVPGGILLGTVSTAYYHSCGIGLDGRAYCWGYGQMDGGGLLGDGVVRSSSAEPVRVAGQE